MRIERSVQAISWVPSESLGGWGRVGIVVGVSHDDEAPPADLGPDMDATIATLAERDSIRYANRLRAWIELDDTGVISGGGYSGGGVMGSTTLKLGPGSVTVPPLALPELRSEPQIGERQVTFRQTVGARTGVPVPRPVKHPPYVQYRAPIAWSTLELTISIDGHHEGSLVGASPFPRHWLYDHDGTLIAKSGRMDYRDWSAHAFGGHTPWGDVDSPAVMTEVETALERELSRIVMDPHLNAHRRRFPPGAVLVAQGEPGPEIFLLLDGVLVVEVDGTPVAQVGPGAILGERAELEGGLRTATLRAVTACRVAALPANQLDRIHLDEVAGGHHREDLAP